MYSLLISCAELAKLNPEKLRVFDCRFNLKEPALGLSLYQKSHLPNAIYANLEKDLSAPISLGSGRHPLPTQLNFIQFLRNAGVDATHQVVVYDDAGGAFAARMWWMLQWVGHHAGAVLNGGFEQWNAEKRPNTNAVPQHPVSQLQLQPSRFKTVDAPTLLKNLPTQKYQVLDARDTARFNGEIEPIDKKAGHIPNAKNYPFKHNLNANNSFLTPAELQKRFAAVVKTHQPQQVVHMCGSGVTACHNLLAMCVAGHQPSFLYSSSWSGWIDDPKNPTVPPV